MALADLVEVSQKRAQMRAQLLNLLHTGEARRIRKAAGITAGQLAHEMDVSETAVFRWENGTRVPRGESAVRYMEVLNELAKVTRGASS